MHGFSVGFILKAEPISGDELRQEITVLLYRKGLPPRKAVAMAGMDRFAFRYLLASRRVPVQYDVEDLEQDIATLRTLFPDEHASS